MASSAYTGPRRPGRWGIFAVALVVSLVTLEIGLQVLEAGLPAVPAPSTIDPYEPNPYIVSYRPTLQQFLPGATFHTQRPSYRVRYDINSLGLRGPEIGPKVKPRLVVLGDSIAEGHGVEFDETFVAGLGRALGPEGWEVTNAAIQGASPIHHAANLARTLALEPDAVFVLLYENDLRDDRARERDYFALPARPSEHALATWRRIENVLGPARDELLERHIETNLRDAQSEEDPPVVFSAQSFPLQWERTQRYLDHLADRLEEEEVPLLVATLALGTLVPRVPETHHVHARNLEDAARTWAESRGLPFLSLYPVTESALDELPWEEVMLADDGHPTAEMHRRFVDALSPWLRRNLLR